MTTQQALTVLSLPAATTFPSENCIQWTEDGQVIILTRQAVVILTAELGIHVQSSSVLRQTLDKGWSDQQDNALGWFKSMIERGKDGEPHQWAFDCQEWSGVSLGSTDLAFLAVSCSPSNVYPHGCCILAVLDSNFEVALYMPLKNQLTGKWTKIGDLAGALEDAVDVIAKESNFSNPSLSCTLHKQILCISWSLQTAFGMSPAPGVNSSILAAGTCAGSVHLIRYQGSPAASIEVIDTVDVSMQRVVHISWSPWVSPTPKQAEALLACATADGSIAIIKVSQSLEPLSRGPTLIHEFKIVLSQELLDTACQPTRRTTTSLRWITSSSLTPILVFSKPGVVSFWTPKSDASVWSGLRTVTLQTQKLSVGSTAVASVSGIAHLPRHDSVVVSLSDGSFHHIGNLSTSPTLSGGDTEPVNSKSLSTLVRRHFISIEGKDIRKLDVNSTHGMASVDEDSTFLWIHEAIRPTDFAYKHDAQHCPTVVIAHLFDSRSNDDLLDVLKQTITNVPRSSSETAISILRRIFVHLYRSQRIKGIADGLLGIISTPDAVDDSLDVELQPYEGSSIDDLRRQLRRSLVVHIFGRSSLLSCRLKVCLANFCERRCDSADLQNAFRLAGTSAVQELWAITLRILVRHLTVIVTVLTPTEASFAHRLAIHATKSGISEAEHLSSKLERVMQENTSNSPADALQEPCPACHASIPFTDPTSAVCPNGHHWPRCSITSYILATPMARTCISCTRKAFLPPPASGAGAPWLPVGARSWLVEDVLDAVRRCLYCGNNFVTLV